MSDPSETKQIVTRFTYLAVCEMSLKNYRIFHGHRNTRFYFFFKLLD